MTVRKPVETERRSDQLAARMIAQIAAAALPEGTDLGTEKDLMACHQVSRGTLRETLRQLEWQGVVRIHRGPGGGIRVSRPSSYVPMFMFKVHFELARFDPGHVRAALRTIQAARSATCNANGNELLNLLLQACDGQFAAAVPDLAVTAGRMPKLHETVAYRITLEIEDRGLQTGDFLGSEADLLARFGVGRGVLREALNLQQLNGIVDLRRGPAGGAFVGTPTADFGIYAACVYLLLAGSKDMAARALLSITRSLTTVPDGLASADARRGVSDPAKLSLAASHLAQDQANPVLQIFGRMFRRYLEDFADGRAIAGIAARKKDKELP